MRQGGDLPDRPSLGRHLAVHVLADEGVLLLSEGARHLLTGRLYERLIPLIADGSATDAIVDALDDEFPPEDVYFALLRLRQAGYLGGDDSPSGAHGAFWEALGTPPGAADERLRGTRFALHARGACAGLEAAPLLRAAGLHLADDGERDIVLVDDYLDPALDDRNRRARATGRPWILCRPVGLELWLGPLFVPGDTGCWECLAHRLRQRRPLEMYARERARHSRAADAPPAHASTAQVGLGLLAHLLATKIGTDATSDLHDTLITFDTRRPAARRHPVTRRPQCPVCGDPTLYARRAERPPRLEPCPRLGPDRRSVAPRRSLARFREHVDAVTGVVTELRRLPASRSLIHAYSAGPNVAIRCRDLSLLRTGFLSSSTGKGRTRTDARVSALGEALERYSGVFHGDEPMVRAPMADLEGAIHPNDCMHFSASQYAERETTNPSAWLPDRVPPPFDPLRPVDWTPVWSLMDGRRAFLPTMLLYYDYPASPDERFAIAVSNGAAAGNTLEEAILHGLLELVERDCVALWWYNRIRRAALDPAELRDPYSVRLRRAYRRLGREWWVLDLTSDLGIPCYAAVTRRLDGPEQILLGLGAHFDSRTALRRALTEMNQVLVLRTGRDSFFEKDETAAAWLRDGTIAKHPHLHPRDAHVSLDTYGTGGHDDVRDDIEHCCRILARHGMDAFVVDQTRPDIEVPVARVVVPQLRHFRLRRGPGRLYDVPVERGWRTQPPTEAELNPVSFFL